ncbi:unnamed protein product [Prorocentrum cordatum]|uniref:Uncharacterized protein n=1 Tax=Prorocentrum cordatum TaxID=2364126 RepID=A0ABN9TBM0_9DINO|nr:unnamed protein product [Polarella glacialis]
MGSETAFSSTGGARSFWTLLETVSVASRTATLALNCEFGGWGEGGGSRERWNQGVAEGGEARSNVGQIATLQNSVVLPGANSVHDSSAATTWREPRQVRQRDAGAR